MKKQFLFFLLSFVLFAGVLSACTTDAPSPSTAMPPEISELPFSPQPTLTLSPVEIQTWRDAYAELLRVSNMRKFFLCDIDGDGIPELLTGGASTDTDKYADYDVYKYINDTIECIGIVGTLSSGSLWLDNNGGILGYSYGAGAGGTYRHYIKNGVLCYDGEIYGYYFDGDGNQIEWFRGSDGSKIIVTEDTEEEYQRILNSKIELKSYDITEANIARVIYDSFKWENEAIAVMSCFNYLNSDGLNGEFDNWFSVYNAYADAYSIFADVPIEDVKTLILPGDEVYCIIPRYENTRIVVKTLNWPLDSDNDIVAALEMEAGDIVFDEVAKAFIICCNVSDLFSNVQITIITDKNELTFSPSISLRDGAVMAGDGVQVLYLEGIYAPVLEID